MARIVKFSQVYDAAEDRVAWITEAEDGERTRLWFTQRLCRKLVATLIPQVEQTTAPHVPAAHRDTAQSWEQAAALADFGKTPPVILDRRPVEGLVRTVDLKASNDGFAFAAHFGGPEPRVLALTTVETRQMLAALHSLFVAAEWSLGEWPAWISSAAAEQPPAAVN